VTVKGILGIEPPKLKHRADLRALLGIDDPEIINDHVFMTDAVATLLGVKPGDRVIVKGIPLTVGPLVSSTRFTAMVDMDNTSIIPIDYAQMQETQARRAPGAADDLLTEQVNWANLPTDSAVVMSDANCARAGGKVSVMHLYTDDAEQRDADRGGVRAHDGSHADHGHAPGRRVPARARHRGRRQRGGGPAVPGVAGRRW
jgi:hypothetical protein